MNSSTIQIPDIPLKRLKDVQIRGNFTIKCDESSQYLFLHQFFKNNGDKIKFKDIPQIGNQFPIPDRVRYIIPDAVDKSVITKFIIKFESLNELLKLREVFNVRASKFDMRLIEKRGYNPFTEDFFEKCADSIIHKVIN